MRPRLRLFLPGATGCQRRLRSIAFPVSQSMRSASEHPGVKTAAAAGAAPAAADSVTGVAAGPATAAGLRRSPRVAVCLRPRRRPIWRQPTPCRRGWRKRRGTRRPCRRRQALSARLAKRQTLGLLPWTPRVNSPSTAGNGAMVQSMRMSITAAGPRLRCSESARLSLRPSKT